MDDFEETIEASAEPEEREPERETPEESAREPEPGGPEAEEPEERPGAPEPEEPALEEPPGNPEPEAPDSDPVIGGDTVQDLINAIDDLNAAITEAAAEEPEELPAEEAGGGAGGGGGGEVQVTETSSVDLGPVVSVLERTNALLVQQIEVQETQHNDLLQLQANVNFVFLAVAALIGVVIGCAVSRVLHDLWRA